VAFTCDTADGSCFAGGTETAGYFLGSAVGPAVSIPELAADYVQNWFSNRGRHLSARFAGVHRDLLRLSPVPPAARPSRHSTSTAPRSGPAPSGLGRPRMSSVGRSARSAAPIAALPAAGVP
jgi:hypothetical protein